MRKFRSEDLLFATAWYRDGPRIGPVDGIYVDADSGRPVWASVPARRLLPLCRAQLTSDRRLLVALPPSAVESAPPLPPGVEEVDRGFEDALYAHYAAALLRSPSQPLPLPLPTGGRRSPGVGVGGRAGNARS